MSNEVGKQIRNCLVVVFISLNLNGCSDSGSSTVVVTAANKDNMKRLTNLYCLFQMQNRWAGPSDRNEFTDFISTQSVSSLKKIGVDPDAIHDLFISERDHQPFNIRYGVSGNIMGSHEAVIFESEGLSGKRLISFTSQKQIEVSSDDEYESYFNGTQSKTAQNRNSGKSDS